MIALLITAWCLCGVVAWVWEIWANCGNVNQADLVVFVLCFLGGPLALLTVALLFFGDWITDDHPPLFNLKRLVRAKPCKGE